MIDDDRTQLERMNEEVEFIIKTTTNVSKDDFLGDSVLQHAICMSIIAIGECANRLSDEFTEKYTEISWNKVVAVRNIAAHGYWQLDMELVWRAVVSDIPQLREFLTEKI